MGKKKQIILSLIFAILIIGSMIAYFSLRDSSSESIPEKLKIIEEINASVVVNADKIIRTIKPNYFGTSIGSLYRHQWREPSDLDDPELIKLIQELKPGFINIQNSMLGLPFYLESTGEFSKRMTVKATLEKMNITSDVVGQELYDEVKAAGDLYNKPPHKNYDDVLRFFENINPKPGISIRINTIFTTLLGERDPKLKLNLDPQTGADLVRYLNDDTSTELGSLRAKNGHPEPYNVTHFVLGNELWTNYQWHGLSLDQIASQHIAFYEAMKKADPDINIGINLVDDAYPNEFFKSTVIADYDKLLGFNDAILSRLKNHLDFVTFHDYGYGIKDEAMTVDILNDEEWRYVMAQNYLREKYDMAGRHRAFVNKYNNKIKVILDEFSGPVGTLGGAVYNADYMIYLINNNYDDFIANWNLGIMEPHTKWGSIRVWENNDRALIKRPNFYVTKMFTNYFGDQVVESVVDSPTFNTESIEVGSYFNWPAEQGIPSIKIMASTKDNKLYLIIINREIDKIMNVKINLNNFIPKSQGITYTLKGTEMNANNEDNFGNVKIEKTNINNVSNIFFYNAPQHSVSVIELER